MEFWCRNCNNEWVDDEQPKECPKCHDWQFEELYTCEDCGRKEVLEDFDFGRLFDGKCYDCFVKSVSDGEVLSFVEWYVNEYKQPYIIRYYDNPRVELMSEIVNSAYDFEAELSSLKDGIAIKTLYKTALKIMKKPVKSQPEKLICGRIREWALDCDGIDFFYDWWCLRNGKNKSSVLWLSDEK